MLIFKRSAIIISRPTGNDHSDDDADCSGNQRYVQKVQSVSVLGNVDVQENDADVEAYGDSSFLWCGVYKEKQPHAGRVAISTGLRSQAHMETA